MRKFAFYLNGLAAAAAAAAGALGERDDALLASAAANAATKAGESAGATLARFLTSNRALRSLSVARCALPPHVGMLLAAALEQRIDEDDTLRALDLSDNRLDPPCGLALAAAHEQSASLVEFSAVGNPMDAAAFAALHNARQIVVKAWAKTDAGRAETKSNPKAHAHRTRGKGPSDFLDGLMQGFT